MRMISLRNTAIARLALLALIALGLCTAGAHASGERGSVGFVLGAPTGLSGKIFLRDTHALDFDVAYDFIRPGLAASGDYLYHFRDVYRNSVIEIAPYVGGGGAIGLPKGDLFGVAARATGGVDFLFQEIPLELFVDLSPGVWIVPRTGFYGAGVIGVRFLFR